MIFSRELYNAPALNGQLVKFTLETGGTVVVTNKNLSGDPYSATIMAFRGTLDEGETIQSSIESEFVALTPTLLIDNNQNGHVLTKGHYALRIEQDASLTIWVNEVGEEPEPDTRIQDKLDRVLTQYRESPNLLGLMATYLTQLNEVEDVIASIESKFDIDTAVGEQLDIIGRWLGFPRCHNVPAPVPVFGFDCDGTYTGQYNIAGFCEGALWLGCPGVSSFEVCITDDELYRNFLYVRRYQLLGNNDYRSFVTCIKILFGSAATYTQTGRVIDVSPGRTLTDFEQTFLRVYERVLPRAVSASVNVNI